MDDKKKFASDCPLCSIIVPWVFSLLLLYTALFVAEAVYFAGRIKCLNGLF